MKNTFTKLVVLAVVSYAMTRCYGQDGTSRVQASESTFKGALIMVKPTQETYRLGTPMPLSIVITNISSADMRLVGTEPSTDDYQVSVYSAAGVPMANSATVGSDTPRMNGVRSRSILTMKPEQSVSMTLDVAELTHIEREGTYYLTIARRMLTWDSGFLMSDKVKIKVVK